MTPEIYPDPQALAAEVRSGLCPYWPHPGIVGCTYCIHTEDASTALASLVALADRAAQLEAERDEEKGLREGEKQRADHLRYLVDTTTGPAKLEAAEARSAKLEEALREIADDIWLSPDVMQDIARAALAAGVSVSAESDELTAEGDSPDYMLHGENYMPLPSPKEGEA